MCISISLSFDEQQVSVRCPRNFKIFDLFCCGDGGGGGGGFSYVVPPSNKVTSLM